VVGIELTFMTMFKQVVVQKLRVQMQFVKVFVGLSGWEQYTNYMLCVLVWGSCMTCCDLCVPKPELLLQDQGK
jgi:hypothetical protein